MRRSALLVRGAATMPQTDMVKTLMTWFRDERGDDLVEYALLAALVGVAGAAVLSAFPGVMGAVYSSWDRATQDQWEPLDPQ